MRGTGSRRGAGSSSSHPSRRPASNSRPNNASPSTSASPLDDVAGGEDGNGSRKRLRVSRACDTCYAKKDKCDGALPVCRVCREQDRRCTYDRPERKRGPLQGVRQRLEGQIETLESILGFLVYAFPALQADYIRNLRLDDGEAFMRSQQASSTSSQAGPSHLPIGEIFPQCTKQHARNIWRSSDLAKSLAPSVGLLLGNSSGLTADDDDLAALTDATRHKYRVAEARRARAHLLGYKMPIVQHHSAFGSSGSDSAGTLDGSETPLTAAAAAFVQHHNHASLPHYPIPVHATGGRFDDHPFHGYQHPADVNFLQPPPLSSSHMASSQSSLMHAPMHAPHSKHVTGSSENTSTLQARHSPGVGLEAHHDAWSQQPFNISDLGEDAHALAYALGLPTADVAIGSGRHMPANVMLNAASSPTGFYAAGASLPSPSSTKRDRSNTRSGSIAAATSSSSRQDQTMRDIFDTPKPFDDDLDALANLAGIHVGPGQASTILFQLGLQDPVSDDIDDLNDMPSEIGLESSRKSPHETLRTRSHWPSRMPVQ